MPPLTENLCRHVERATGRRVVTNDRRPPAGFTIERDLGVINRFPLQGTVPLVATGGELPSYRTIENLPAGELPDDIDGEVLGHPETAPLPMLEPLQLAVHAQTGQHVLVCGPDDPLTGAVEVIATLGWLDLFPVNPRQTARVTLPYGTGLGLLRVVDRSRRRHVYGIGSVPDGELAGELGSLKPKPDSDSVPVWLSRGWLLTDAYSPRPRRAGLRAAVRWTLAPLTWHGFATPGARTRAAARRAFDSFIHLLARPKRAAAEGEPIGYLFREPGPGRLPLYAAVHPVTQDQLLSPWPLEIDDMGYKQSVLLGYVLQSAPVTGRLGVSRVTLPWASRFGQTARAG
jgi:hypothetical protein